MRDRGLDNAFGEATLGAVAGLLTSFRSHLYHHGGKHLFAHVSHLVAPESLERCPLRDAAAVRGSTIAAVQGISPVHANRGDVHTDVYMTLC